jgi:hypothetical protein
VNSFPFESLFASTVATCLVAIAMFVGWRVHRRVAMRSSVVANAVFILFGLFVALVSHDVVYRATNWAANRGKLGDLSHSWVHPGTLWYAIPVLCTVLLLGILLWRDRKLRR